MAFALGFECNEKRKSQHRAISTAEPKLRAVFSQKPDSAPPNPAPPAASSPIPRCVNVDPCRRRRARRRRRRPPAARCQMAVTRNFVATRERVLARMRRAALESSAQKPSARGHRSAATHRSRRRRRRRPAPAALRAAMRHQRRLGAHLVDGADDEAGIGIGRISTRHVVRRHKNRRRASPRNPAKLATRPASHPLVARLRLASVAVRLPVPGLTRPPRPDQPASAAPRRSASASCCPRAHAADAHHHAMRRADAANPAAP